MLDAIRRRVERALFFGKVLRASKVVTPLRPTQLAQFVKGARQSALGPHLAVMFHAAAHPDKEALVEYGEHGVKRLTWGEFDATINRLAQAFVQRGVRGGTRVAIMLPNCSEYLIAQQALARLGATAVQIGYRSKAGEIAYILENAEPVATLVHASYIDAMNEARISTKRGGPMIVIDSDGKLAGDLVDWDQALAEASPVMPPRTKGGDGGGVIVYTSGTTGKPKGANRSWRKTGFESVADMILQVGARSDDRHLVVCPLYHSAAPAFVAIMMSLGATVVLMNHFDLEGALDIIQRERITCTLMVPTMLIRISNLPAETLAKYDTRSLRWVMSAAAPLTTEAARRFMEHFGPVLWNFYGATETGLVTLAGPHDHVNRPGTIGRALRGNEIRLLDDAGHDVDRGGVGELYARNSTLMSGYHNNDEATTSAQRDGYYSVGDLGRVDDDGYYFLESRKHDMVISGGVNIYPREIEDHLNNHPAILEAAVVGVPDPEWGETLRAFIVLRTGQSITETEVIDFCRTGLADFKRPRKVTFLEELPRNPTGKVLKRELRDL
ncbi:MAG: AMP-binding protein [Deltaproteobacteria bacterium]|nr:AMP-binding protein [Deltaproteobacteria bacterium]MDQ3296621.1 AMP-binding protein [Myxococcota bacterium]